MIQNLKTKLSDIPDKVMDGRSEAGSLGFGALSDHKSTNIFHNDVMRLCNDAELRCNDAELHNNIAELHYNIAEMNYNDVKLNYNDAELNYNDAELNYNDAELICSDVSEYRNKSEIFKTSHIRNNHSIFLYKTVPNN